MDIAVTGRHRRSPTACWPPSPPKNFLRPCVLLLLDERPDYGYELRERLRHLSGTQWDAGTVYRVLNAMEDEGLVASHWEPSTSGPQRRRYEVTSDGPGVLGHWAQGLREVRDLLVGFLDRYEGGRSPRALG